jgi:hypothetical protein
MMGRPEDTKMRALSSGLLLLGLCIGAAPSLRASISFTGGAGQGTTGNSLSFSGTGLNVTAHAFSTTGSSGTLAQAALGQWSPGLGVCNTVEIATPCTSPNHAVDSSGAVDFVLLQFSVPLTSISLTLSPFGTTQDMDATYFFGNCTGTCTAANFLTNILGKADTTVGLAAITGVTGVNTGSFLTSPTNLNTTFSLSGLPGSGVNWVLIGANTADTDGVADYFKLNSMSYGTVPEPATFGLAGIALAAMGFLRARKKRSATV